MLLLCAAALIWSLSSDQPARGQAAGSGPHGGYLATDDSCAGCHRGHAGGGELLTIGPNDNAFCYACHDGTGASATPVVSTHGNLDFSGAEADFRLDCVACHEPHGSTNLAAIRTFVAVQRSAGIEAGPIVFTARTGTNSFDDGTSAPSSRLCVACHQHPDNPGYPMTNHTGGAGHLGGANYEGQDCIGCHPHSADGIRENSDGFMPVGGCSSCHATPQDNGDNLPPGGRRAVIADFENNSHHVQGTVDDVDCVACHDMTEHQQGQVRLKDADTGAVLALIDRPGNDPAVAAALEPWCLACHDADGAGGAAPFSDGIMPPLIDATAWAAASHDTSAAVGTCWNCHDNGHGSVKQKLLAPWDATPDPGSPDDPLHQEEGFCFACHDADGPATSDVQAVFGLLSHHDVGSLEQQGNGAKVECVSCHNPHQNNQTSPTSNPDDPQQLWTGESGAFCLTCHDGTAPSQVTFPATWSGTGYDKLAYVGTAHDSGLGGRDCLHCHDQHGSTYPSLLLGEYVTADNTPFSTANYQLCFTCHVQESVVGSTLNAFQDYHSEHVLDQNAPCIHCHDAHAPFDAGEPGLISLVFGVDRLDITLNTGFDHSTAFTNALSGGSEGTCYIQCHGKTHGADTTYSRTPIETTDCSACHSAGGP